MTDYPIAPASEIDEGERMIVQIEGREIAVFNVDGEYYAYVNWCAHQSGPVCEGKLSGERTAVFDKESLSTEFEWSNEGNVLYCPWHGWRYDITTGECRSRNGITLPPIPVRVEEGEVVVSV